MDAHQAAFTKRKLAVAILLAVGSMAANAEMMELGSGNNNFTMLSPAGDAVGTGANDVVVMWDGTYNTSVDTALVNMTITSATPFFGVPWYAHDVQVYGPGSYTFEACPGPLDPVTFQTADGSTKCSVDNTPQTMVVGEGQVGAHMLFDWNGTVNIDVVNVWDVNAVWGFGLNDGTTKNVLATGGTSCVLTGKFAAPDTAECQALLQTEWLFAATDPDGNGTAGSGMVDGPFKGFNATFNIRPQVVPVPAAVWLMGSGLLGLIGVARRKKA